MDCEGYKTHLCVTHQIKMKFTLAIAASLALYASSAFGQSKPHISFYSSTSNERCSGSVVDEWDVDCSGGCGVVKGNANTVGLTSGTAACHAFQSTGCTGQSVEILSLDPKYGSNNPACLLGGNNIGSAKCTC